MGQPTLVIGRPVFPDVLDELRRHARVLDNQAGTSFDAATWTARLADADGLMVSAVDPVTADLLQATPRLRIVANIGVGHDNVDTAACAARGVIVTNTPGVVDDGALAAALQRGVIAAAGLDVFEGEPQVHPGLLGLPNVVLAPHVGSATRRDTRWCSARRVTCLRSWREPSRRTA